MLHTFSSLKRTFLLLKDEKKDTPIGVLLDTVIDPEKGRICAFWCTALDGRRLLLPEKIINWDKGSAIIESEKEFLVPEDAVRLRSIFKKEVPVIGAKVWDRTKYIGTVYDFSFDRFSMSLFQIFAKKGFWLWGKKMIIPRSKIVKINEEGIFISQNKIRTLDDVVESSDVSVRTKAKQFCREKTDSVDSRQ